MILALDLGGTSIKYGIVDREGRVTNESSIKSNKDDYSEYLGSIVELCKEFGDVDGIAISAPGGVLPDGKTVGLTAIPCIEFQNMKVDLESATGKVISIANDASCTIMSELFETPDLINGVGIVVGSGIGGGIMVNGELVVGKDGIAGEFGVSYERTPEGMKRIALSTVQMEEAFNIKHGTNINAKQIFNNFKQGDYKAIEAVNDFFKGLAIITYNVEGIIHPEVIVFAGGITEDPDFLELLEKAYDDLRPYCGWDLEVKHKVSKFKSFANLPGAAAYWIKQNG